jgi:glucose-1-phosphatase
MALILRKQSRKLSWHTNRNCSIYVWYSVSLYFCIMERTEIKIHNIIFDLGGVLIDLDINLTGIAFAKLGINQPADEIELLRRTKVYTGLETGEISASVFRKSLREISTTLPSDSAIDDAWNAMLLDFPADRVTLLLNLGKKYRLFLLSNSNAIHHKCYTDKFRQVNGFEMNSLFERAHYSFEMKMKKPSPEIFQKVLAENQLLANETLFIDDTMDNIKTAAGLGFKVHHIHDGEDMIQLFSNGIWID